MKATSRITLTITGIYLISGIVLAFIMYSQATKDVATEINASLALADALVEQNVDFATIEAALQHSRHLTALAIDSPAGSTLNSPDASFFPVEPVSVFSHPEDPRRQLFLFANPAAEREEILTTVYQVFGLLAISLLFTLSVMHIVVQSRMKPLQALSSALSKVAKGNYRVDVEHSDIEEIDSVVTHTQLMASALEERENKVQQLRNKLASLQEHERQNLARELHDNLGQLVTGIRVQSYMLRQQTQSPKFIERTATLLGEQCAEIQSGIRQLVNKLYPVTLNKMGLVSALREMLERWSEIHNIAVTCSLPDLSPEKNIERDMHLYRITQEALSNVSRHAHASKVHVSLTLTQNAMTLNITDNGTGFAEQSECSDGLGLASMRDRARLTGGHFAKDNFEEGARIQVVVPLTAGTEKSSHAHITC